MRIAAIGDVDELNSNLGVLLAETLPDGIRTALVTIQHDLFDLGGELCIPGHTVLDDTHLARLDRWLADYNATLPPLKEYPAGRLARGVARARRTVCRRAEFDRRARAHRDAQ